MPTNPTAPGTGRKCPHCGAAVEEYSWRCSSCRNVIVDGTIRPGPKPPTRLAPDPTRANPLTVRTAKAPFQVAVVFFSDDANVAAALTDARHAAVPPLSPGGYTNIAGGLEQAEQILASSGARERYVVVATDGDANRGGGKQGAIDVAQRLHGAGVRVSSIAIQGGGGHALDLDTVRALASSPALFEEAWSGQIRNSFVRVTKTMTATSAGGATGRALVLVVDSSGSMAEGTKKSETEAAMAAVVSLCGTI